MNDDHMQRWQWENTNDDAPWQNWADHVERLLGHDLDGSQNEDGYSLDHAYDMYKEGLTVLDAVHRIEHSKNELRKRRGY